MLPVAREVLAHADHLGELAAHAGAPLVLEGQCRVGNRVAGKYALHALLLQAKADVVILGQALHVEGDAVTVFEQGADGAAAETGADTGTGHLAGQRFADDDVLAVVLGELVHVVPGGEAFPLRRIGVHRDLDHVLGGQQVVEQPQLHGRDNVLGVMQDEACELDTCVVLEAQDGIDDVVQAVSLAGGAGAGADHLVHVGVVQAHGIDVGLGLRVVGVGADKDLVVFVVDGRGRQARHFTHHAHFVPSRDHDRQGFFRHLEQALLVGPGVLVIDAQMAEQLAAPVAQVDEQVVQAEQEHQCGEDDRQDLEAKQYVSNEIDESQAHASSRLVTLSSNQRLRRSAMISLAWPSPKGVNTRAMRA
ncbi:hypothetical protein D3C78_585550 [compost metagenome]